MNTRPYVLLALLWLAACFVDGKEVIAPTDADYAAICVDSTATDESRACFPIIVIRLEIPNPNPPRDSVTR